MKYPGLVKRVFDFVFCVLALPLVLPVLAIIACGIFIDSGRPIFYRGIRAGLHGKSFRIFKFRTMVMNAEKIGGGTTALHDSRITEIGGFLRTFKLDELPQIFNILLGQMSFVGPRPELLQYTARYAGDEQKILDLRPGITDFSSITFSSLNELVGRENADVVYEETILKRKNQLRIKYVNECSFFLDLRLILLTLWILLKRALKIPQISQFWWETEEP